MTTSALRNVPFSVRPRRAWLMDGQVRVMWDVRDNDFGMMLSEIKERCPLRRWDPKRSYWVVAPSTQLMAFLDKWGFRQSDDLAKLLNRFKIVKVDNVTLPKGLSLHNFQEDGVRFGESRQGRFILGDEMGLGKTIQALAWLRIHPEARPAVIVVPASLKLNWERESRKWLERGENIMVLNGEPGNNEYERIRDASIIVVNYDILPDKTKKGKNIPGWVRFLKNKEALVIDECHYIKNKTKRTNAVKELAKGVPYIIGISGTPIVNRPAEFFNIIKLVNPTVFPSWYHFSQKYCDPKWNGFATDYSGSSNTEELHRILTETVMIRRLTKDVLDDLPDKIRSVVPMEIDNREEYEEAVENFLGWLKRTEGIEAANRASSAEALVAVGKLKQLAARGKLNAALSWIEDVVESGEKVVVFAVHKAIVDAVMARFGKQAVKLTGSESQTQRQIAVDAFQGKIETGRKRVGTEVVIKYEDIPANKQPKIFVGNIQAAGVGITLTAASIVAFLELPWTPGELVQAEDRLHRIGQKNVVNVYYLVGVDTIEEDIAKMLDEKADVISQVLDGKNVEQESILSNLLRQMRVREGK